MALLERERDLAVLDAALRESVAGEGRLVLVSGEAGIGKTALVTQFLRGHPEAEALIGHCDPLITPTPLGPLHDIARRIGGALHAQLEAAAPRAQLFATLLEGLRDPQRPTILVLEDIHWADEATLDLVSFIGRRVASTRALLVLTLRDDEVGNDHPLRRTLGSLASAPQTRRIALAPLSIEAVGRMLGARELDAASLHRTTGGNPFFVNEIVTSSVSGVPATIRDAVLARCARMTAEGRRLLDLLAVIGPRINQQVLARLTGFDQAAFEDSLSSGILRKDDDGVGFRHELARVAVLDAMNPARRRDSSRAALQAVAQGAGSERGELALLAQYAEGAADHDAVVAFGLQAAEAASALGAHREAAAQYRRVVRSAAGRPPQERAGYYEALGRACSLLDDVHEAAQAYRQAIELHRAAGSRLREGAAYAELAWPLVRGGLNADAEAASRAAIDLLETLPESRELAVAYRVQAHLRMLDRERAPAMRWGTRAIRLATKLKDHRTVAEAEMVVGCAQIVTGDERGRAALDRCLAIARSHGLDPLVALTHSNAGSCYGEQYRFAEAEREFATGLAFTRNRDLTVNTLYMTAWLALTRLHQGRWAEAAETAAAVLAEPNCAVVSRIMALVALGRVRARRGDADAMATLDDALALAERTDTLQRLAPVRLARAEAAWLAGDPERTLSEAKAAFALALRHRHRWHAGEMAFWQKLAGAPVAMPRWAARPYALQSAGQWQKAAAEWERLGCPYEQARALAEGDLEAQLRALDIFTGLGAGPAATALRQRARQAGVRTIPRGPRASTRSNRFGLTPRQMTILDALRQGLSNKQIAAHLRVAPKTVDHHVSAVLAKLGVASRHDAIRVAKDEGLVKPI